MIEKHCRIRTTTAVLLFYAIVSNINLDLVHSTTTLNLAVMVPWSGDYGNHYSLQTTAAVPVALDDIASLGLLPGYSVNWTWKDSQCADPVGSRVLEETYDYFNGQINGIIGEACSSVCQLYGLLAAAWNVPVVSFDCTYNRLSNKTLYPTFARLTFPTVEFIKPINDIFDHFKWTRVAIVSDTRDINTLTADAFDEYLENQGKIVYRYVVDSVYDSRTVMAFKIPAFLKVLLDIKQKARVILYLANDTQFLVYAAYKLGMRNGEYVLITAESVDELWPNFDDGAAAGHYLFLKNMGPPFSQEAYTGTMYITLSPPPDAALWNTFSQRVSASFNDPHFSSSYIEAQGVDINTVNKNIAYIAGVMYYSVMLWAIGLNKTLQDGGTPLDGLQIANNMFDTTVTFGPFQHVTVDSEGDGHLNMDLVMAYNTQPDYNDYVILFRVLAANDSIVPIYLTNPNVTISWGGDRHAPPTGEPPCGWNGCPVIWTTPLVTGVGFGIFFVVLVVTLVTLLFVNRFVHTRMKVRLLEKAFIKRADIEKFTPTHDRGDADTGGSVTAAGTVHSSYMASTTCGNSLIQILVVDNASGGDVINTSTLLKEVEQMLKIQHENLCRFVGVCVEAEHQSVAMSYCAKGTLQDVLQDASVGSEFLPFFATDVAEGLLYLHKSDLGSHGLLKSTCCYVDSFWAVKISDYGMACFKQRRLTIEKAFNNPLELLWTAPELLRTDAKQWPLYGTPEGDVYSFGIVLQEIACRDMPYSQLLAVLGPTEIINRVTDGSTPPAAPFRPDPRLASRDVNKAWLELMKACWAEAPADRLTMVEVRASLTKMGKEKHASFADKAIKLLECHTLNLEELVQEQMSDLVREQKKWENLLDQLFPRSVAKQLLAGVPVQPQSYASVTIGFTDIVGFQKFVFVWPPLKIVAFLNQVYKLHDGVISRFDVCKMETIGDICVMCSGLPETNEGRHVSEMATASLHLLHESVSFQTTTTTTDSRDHSQSFQQLQLRVGLHTGAAVADVTGIVRPRYSLYGDTINIASRMLTSGLALRIHVSSDTTAVLLKDGDYVLESRGERDVKGRGKMTTYWLQRKKSLVLPLPDLTVAASDSEHYFK